MKASETYTPTHRFASVQLAARDRIRLTGFPSETVPVVGEALQTSWAAGVKSESAVTGGYEWKLQKNPWEGSTGAEHIAGTRVVLSVLTALSSIGWNLHTASRLVLAGGDWAKDDLIFRFSAPPHSRKSCFAVTFNSVDKTRIIDPPDEDVRDAFIYTVEKWPHGIKKSYEKEPDVWQLDLSGHPSWTKDQEKMVQTRLMCCDLLNTFEKRGYELVGSVDMGRVLSDNKATMDTWFFASTD